MKQILLIIALLLPVCAFSQFSETFDGSSISSRWESAEILMFCIDEGRLLFDGTGQTGNYSITTPVDYSDNMEWEFDVAMDFKPSTSNYTNVYVYANDTPNQKLYHLRIGYYQQSISLYEWGSKNVAVIKGRSILEIPPSSVRVKLTLEKLKVWTLYTRKKDESSFTKEGEYSMVPLSNIRPRGQIVLDCYSKAKTLKDMRTYFDNFRVTHTITPTDTIPEEPEKPEPEEPSTPSDPLPQLVEIIPQSASDLQFHFDDEVNISNASFSISTIGEAIRKSHGETKSVVNTLFPSPMQKDTEYTISYAGLTSASGKQLPEESWTAVFESDGEEPDDPSAAGSVWINEVMADPKGVEGLPETEYVELYNTSASSVQLKGWTFIYDNRTSVVLPDYMLPGGGYVVLYREGRTVEADKPGQGMPLDKFPSALANAGKVLALKDATGKLIDEITYSKAKPGISWERSVEGWYLSTDSRGGTPGSKNSSSEAEPEEPDTPEEPETPDEPDEPSIPEEPTFPDIIPQDIVFNELLPEPFTEGSEYIELYNRSRKAVSLKGLSVATRKTDGSLNTHYPLSSISATLPEDGYALLTKAKEGVSSLYLISAPEAVHELKLPVLANTSSTLVLFRSKDEVVIDEVSYSSRWHAASVKEKKGVALERIDPEARTQDSGNWTSASETAGYGTPGYRNSQMRKPEEGGITGIEPPLFIDATGFYSIVYHLDEPGYNCRAYIFDLSGRRVAEITNHQLLGVEGELTWDGLASDGRRLETGIYILCIELYHAGGQTRIYKKVFPVR